MNEPPNKKLLLFFLFFLIILNLFVPKKAYAEWDFLGLSGITLHDIKIAPSDNNIIYAGSSQSRDIFKSNDGGKNWQSIINNDLPPNPDVDAISISHTNSQKVYIGVYDKGVYKSTNGGLTWIKTNMPNGVYIRSIVVDPNNDETIYAGTGTTDDNGGIYKSIDGGLTWQIKLNGIGRKNIMSIAVCKKDSQIIFASGGPDIWKSSDQGENWISLNFGEAGGTCMTIDPENCNIAFAAKSFKGPYKTVDGGLSWFPILEGIGETKIQTLTMSLLKSNILFAASRQGPFYGVFKTVNTGESWNNITENLTNHYAWAIDAINEKEVLVGISNGGIWKYKEKAPIVLLPGFTGSWNLPAITGGVASDFWERVPIFWPYYNLQHTLTSTEAGYEESKNYFEFYYDWRKRIDDLADDFNDYLSKTVLVNQPSETKVNLIGHSMGGLIARAYANKYGGEKIEKLITVGSPHQGVLESYYAREGGVADERFSFKNIILRLLLEIHRSKYSNTKELVNNMILSVKDMFPIFDFLKTQEGTVIDINSLSIQNDYLKNLVDPETLKPKTINIHGKENNPNKDTSEYYRIIEAPPEYKLQGLWPDGFPYDKEYTENGDLTVLTKSALTPTASSSAQVDGDHIEIIESALGIQAILDALGITGVTPNTNYTSPIVRGLLFLLGSPANIKVITPNNDQVGHDVPSPGLNTYYSEANKLIYIPNAPSGDYYVELSGTNEGIYHLYTGQLTDDEDVWQTIKGKIGKYEIVPLYLNFNPQNPQENMIKDENGETLLKLTKQQLEDLNEYARINISHSTVKRKLQYQFGKIIKIIDKALNYLEDHNYFQGSLYASSALNQSLRLRITLNQYLKQEKITSEKANYLKNELEETAKLLSSAWVNLYQKAGKTITSKKLSRYQSALEKIKVRLETDIENKVSQGEDKNLGKAYFNAISFWNKAEEYTQENKLEEAYINYFTSRLYLLETTKLLH